MRDDGLYIIIKAIYNSLIIKIINKATTAAISAYLLLDSLCLFSMHFVIYIYIYINGEVSHGCKDWERFLCDRLDRFYYIIPGNYRVPIPAGYHLPETWDYADNQIIPWFQE
ncbi:hypothetical protein HZ326_8417 [Fusarium oxysporum f. sp. albedinis]|nr:hypothetical protein HZ326_8417 [Fusarium oxysporum f. sp. albedinis]